MDQYSALIVDIVRSRSYAPSRRSALQDLLIDTIECLNDFFSPGIVAPVMFSAGDEVQGLFADAGTAFLYLRFLMMTTSPCELSAGIGVGAWSVRIGGNVSTMQDGPAYHRAREAVAAAHAEKTDLVQCRCGSDDDWFLSSLMARTLDLSRSRSMPQDELAFAIELLYPLYPDNWNPCGPLDWQRLLELKLSFEQPDRESLLTQIHSERASLDQRSTVHLEELVWHMRELKREPALRGISYELEHISGFSRQGLSRLVLRGQVAQERTSVAVVQRAISLAEGRWRNGIWLPFARSSNRPYGCRLLFAEREDGTGQARPCG